MLLVCWTEEFNIPTCTFPNLQYLIYMQAGVGQSIGQGGAGNLLLVLASALLLPFRDMYTHGGR